MTVKAERRARGRADGLLFGDGAIEAAAIPQALWILEDVLASA